MHSMLYFRVGDIGQGIHPGCALNWDFFHSLESTLHYRFLVGSGIRSSKMYIQHSIHLKMDLKKRCLEVSSSPLLQLE
jgi:hypothetical protein